MYRGVFGSHVANVLRRLRRIAAIHGSDPRFVMTSATIANPVELAERLTGIEPFQLIDRDGAPRPERRIAIWNPPLLDEELGSRALGSVRGRRGVLRPRRRRRADDLLHEVAQRDRADSASRPRPSGIRNWPNASPRIGLAIRLPSGWRSRRRLTHGDLLGDVTTDALELGIDIGELDAAVCVTFPGPSRASNGCGAEPDAADAGWRSTSPARRA